MPIVRCQQCGESEDLSGARVGNEIEITCNVCGRSWLRDAEPTCPDCGGRALRATKEPVVQRARGTAYSVVGEKTTYLCEACDAGEIARRFDPLKTETSQREDPWK